MRELIQEVLEFERDKVLEARAHGTFLLRPSTVALIAIGLLYLTSSIDIVPELFITPKLLGFIDDVIVLTVIIIYTYRDWGEIIEGTVQFGSLRKSKHGGESEVPVGDRHEESHDDWSDSRISRNHSEDGNRSVSRESAISRDNSDDNPVHDDDDSIFSSTSSADSDSSESTTYSTARGRDGATQSIFSSGESDDGSDDEEESGTIGLP